MTNLTCLFGNLFSSNNLTECYGFFTHESIDQKKGIALCMSPSPLSHQLTYQWQSLSLPVTSGWQKFPSTPKISINQKTEAFRLILAWSFHSKSYLEKTIKNCNLDSKAIEFILKNFKLETSK